MDMSLEHRNLFSYIYFIDTDIFDKNVSDGNRTIYLHVNFIFLVFSYIVLEFLNNVFRNSIPSLFYNPITKNEIKDYYKIIIMIICSIGAVSISFLNLFSFLHQALDFRITNRSSGG